LDQPVSGIIGQALTRTSTAKGFLFFNFSFEYLKRLSKFWTASNKSASIPPSYLAHGLYEHKPISFLPNRSPKMRESQQLFFGLRLVRRIFEETLTSRNPNQNSATLWQIFSSNKSASANRKTGFYMYKPWSEQAGGWIHFLYEAAQNFEVFSNKYSKVKLKNQNPIAIDALFKAFPMVQLPCRSNLAGQKQFDKINLISLTAAASPFSSFPTGSFPTSAATAPVFTGSTWGGILQHSAKR
jgi:hypothetical protein